MNDNIPASRDPTELCSLIACIPTVETIVIKKEPFKVGRSTHCDFVFEEKNVENNFICSISKVHFEISKDENSSVFYITDFSKNGTYLSGTRLKKYEKKDLKEGDLIALGFKNYNVFSFRTRGFPDTATTMKLPDSQTPNGSEEVKAWGHLISCMMYLDSFDLHNIEFKVGRSKKCDVVIKRTTIDQSIKNIFSKEHFIIFKDPDNVLVFIRDLSRAGTFLNGKLIGKNNAKVLKNDDVIGIGQNKLQLFVYKCELNKNYWPVELDQKFEPSTSLGRGTTGEMRLAFEKFTGKTVAIKKIQKSKSSLSEIYKLTHPTRVKTAINILQTLKHPCVINIKDIVETPKEVYIVLDYMKGGELTNRILSETPLSESNVKFLFYQMVLAVQFLHEKGITHRDLKPENVLLYSDDKETLVKVSDFGLSTVTQGDDKMTAVCGTLNYIAPEVLDSRVPEYGKQVDVWSLGVILFYMLSKRLPFQCSGETVLVKHIITGYYVMEENQWNGVSASARDLVKKMLNVNPQKRISIKDILKHPWLEKDVEVKCKLKSLLENHLHQTFLAEGVIMTYGMDPPRKRLRLSK